MGGLITSFFCGYKHFQVPSGDDLFLNDITVETTHNVFPKYRPSCILTFTRLSNIKWPFSEGGSVLLPSENNTP